MDRQSLWEKYMEYLRNLNPLENKWSELTEMEKIPIIAFLFNREIYGDGVQSYFELWGKNFSIDDVEKAYIVLSVNYELLELVREIKGIQYISDDDLYQSSESEEEFDQLMEARDVLWDEWNARYYETENNDVDEKIMEYVEKNLLNTFGLSWR